MPNTYATYADSSISIFHELIATLSFQQFNDIQLCDLGAIAAESAIGLCHELHYLGESLANAVAHPPEKLAQLGAGLKAIAHLLPVLMEINEQAHQHLQARRPLDSAMPQKDRDIRR